MDFAYLQVVRICNQKCIFCAQPSNGRIESLKNLKKKIDAYIEQGFTGIILNGGEPTLHKNLPEIIAYARSCGMYTKVITNGIRFQDGEYLKKCIDAGLQHIHVSIHSYIPTVENFLMRGDVFHSQIQGLKNLLQYKGKVFIWINIALNQYNIRHLDKTILFFCKLSVDGFVINQLEVSGVYPGFLEKLLFRLSELEAPLQKALGHIKKFGKVARVSRVPLCYMRGFEEFSRDGEYFILHERRYVNYLTGEEDMDHEDYVSTNENWQNEEANTPGSKRHSRTESCNNCDLKDICSGYDLLQYFPDENPLVTQYVSPDEKTHIINTVLGKK